MVAYHGGVKHRAAGLHDLWHFSCGFSFHDPCHANPQWFGNMERTDAVMHHMLFGF